ncbi:DnaJ C-terminal domain-containing protein [Lichenicoccus sp.]|uniref:DnaJ C-terminal domain-containing protein n=1 Tax=Lichenicoccus sp. TaxID=2781899 RepID=UPI003D13B0A6
MADDPYATLGVARDADADAIRKAYRKLARKHHPDLNPGDKAAEERFKAVSGAKELLSDNEKRARYDRGEIDASGQERHQPRGPGSGQQGQQRRYRDYAESEAGRRYGASAGAGAGAAGWSEEDFGDIFGEYFRHAGGGGATGPARGRDETYALDVAFVDTVTGATRRLTLPDGRTLDVRIPPGIEDGTSLRLRGRGGAGREGGPDGDALIEIRVLPDAAFRRVGRDIHLDLPVTLKAAVLGAKLPVPTPSGTVALSVPPDSDTGRQLRLRGKGVAAHGGHPAGDLYVTLRVSVGAVDDSLRDFLRHWTPPVPPNASDETKGAA